MDTLDFWAQRRLISDMWGTHTDLEATPSLTDQSQANDTDINVIVKRYGIHGQAPGASTPPQFGDFTGLPDNLRDMIEMARTIEARRKELPQQLAEMPIEDILALTTDQLTTILNPPAPKPDDKKDDGK